MTKQKARKWLLRLLLIECCLAGVYTMSSILDQPIGVIHTLFDLDGEGNIPAWFSAAQLFLIGLLLLGIGQGRSSLANRSARVLSFFGVVLIYLAFDEAFAIHEKLSFMLRGYPWIPRLRERYGLWMPVYAAIGVLIALVTLRDLRPIWHRHRREAQIILLGAAIFVFGAVGMEIVKYQFLYKTSIPYIRGVEIIVEEMSEMAGASLILYGVALLGIRLRDQRLSS